MNDTVEARSSWEVLTNLLQQLLREDEAAVETLEGLADQKDDSSGLGEVARYLSLLIVKLEGREYLLNLADDTETRLRHLNELKNRHLAIAAHDLRNPLGTIRGLAKLTANSPSSEDKRQTYLESIIRISDEMLNLLENLLDVAVIESGRFELDLTEGSLSEMARQRGQRAAEAGEEKGVEVVDRIEPVPATRFDAPRMGQVLDNLLSNAVKFSPRGSTVEIHCSQLDGAIEIRVQDHGPGIPEEEIPRIFDPYGRSKARPTAGEKSTGLGLSIVKPIIHAHGGTLEVASTVGEGTTFIVRMPMTGSSA